MNSDEVGALVRRLLIGILSGTAGARLAKYGIDTASLASLGGAVAVLGWGVYSHWNMKKVPEDTKVI